MKKKLIAALLVLTALCFCFVGCQFQTDKNGGLPDDLIDTLTEYLKQINTNYELTFPPFEEKINKIKNGTEALRVSFDPDDYYFVCAYYNDSSHEESDYCCADKYYWAKFKRESNIKETHYGKVFVVAFQINKTKACENIIYPEKATSTVEHYQIYKPTFQNLSNIAQPIVFDEHFVHLNVNDKSVNYISIHFYQHELTSFPYISLDGENYYYRETRYVYPDGENIDIDLSWEFGEYYDELMGIMIFDKHSKTYSDGTVYYYGLLNLNDLADLIKK